MTSSPNCARSLSIARSACSVRRSSKSDARDLIVFHEPGDPDAEQPVGGAVGFAGQQVAADAKMLAASCVGVGSDWARARRRKSAVLSLSVTVRAGEMLSLQAAGDALREAP